MVIPLYMEPTRSDNYMAPCAGQVGFRFCVQFETPASKTRPAKFVSSSRFPVPAKNILWACMCHFTQQVFHRACAYQSICVAVEVSYFLYFGLMSVYLNKNIIDS